MATPSKRASDSDPRRSPHWFNPLETTWSPRRTPNHFSPLGGATDEPEPPAPRAGQAVMLRTDNKT